MNVMGVNSELIILVIKMLIFLFSLPQSLHPEGGAPNFPAVLVVHRCISRTGFSISSHGFRETEGLRKRLRILAERGCFTEDR